MDYMKLKIEIRGQRSGCKVFKVDVRARASISAHIRFEVSSQARWRTNANVESCDMGLIAK
jgi:hypothetical protein